MVTRTTTSTPTTATTRVVSRPGRRIGRRARVFDKAGRDRVARTARLETAGPVIFLLLVALAAAGATLAYSIIG